MEASQKITCHIIHKKINTCVTKNDSPVLQFITRYNAAMQSHSSRTLLIATSRFTSTLMLLFCMVFALAFLVCLLITCWPGPYNDYWADIWTLHKALTEGIDLAELITAHNNAHRILIPRLLFVLDYQWFQGTNLLILLTGLACKAAILVLLNRMVCDQSVAIRLLLNTIFFAAFFSTNNLYNILYSSNIQWDLMLVFSVFAIYAYVKNLANETYRIFWFIAAYLFTALGLLSHAGTLAVLPVFWLISILHRDIKTLVFSLLAAACIFYLTFYVLPVSDPENDTYESALMMMLVGSKTVAFFVFNLLDSGLYQHIGAVSFCFSAWLLACFLVSLFYIRKTQNTYRNIFLLIAIFAILAMIEIAAARSAFTPKHWGSSRFHGVSLLFIAAISTHIFLAARHFFQQRIAVLLQGLIFLHALAILLLVQYFSYQDAFGLSNKVFKAQAYMFSHQRNQFDGDKLVTFFNEKDRIAGIDPFFTAHDYAYYANKQNQQSAYQQLAALDSSLLSPTEMSSLAPHCLPLIGTLQSTPDEEGKHLAISWQLDQDLTDLLRILFFRNTYYLLDEQGSVSGFVYLYLDPQKPWLAPAIKGFASSTHGKYMVEIDDAEARCLYSLSFNPQR